MCLAIPGRITEIMGEKKGIVDFMGVTKEVALDLIGDCEAGDYVIVHAGFAINKLDKEDTVETINYLKQLCADSR